MELPQGEEFTKNHTSKDITKLNMPNWANVICTHVKTGNKCYGRKSTTGELFAGYEMGKNQFTHELISEYWITEPIIRDNQRTDYEPHSLSSVIGRNIENISEITRSDYDPLVRNLHNIAYKCSVDSDEIEIIRKAGLSNLADDLEKLNTAIEGVEQAKIAN